MQAQSGEIDGGDTEDEGYEYPEDAQSGLAIDLRGLWNAAQNMHAAPLYIYDGAVLEHVYVFLSKSQLWAFYAPKFKVLTLSLALPVKDGIKYAFSGKAQGRFYYPGNVSP